MHHQLAASGNFGQVVRRNYPVAIASRLDEPATEEVSIVGCLCTPLDRLADATHLETGSQRLNWTLSQQWKKASSYHRASARVLRGLLKDGSPGPETLAALEPDLLQALVPVWTTSPLALAEFPADMGFDTVLLLDAESLALSTALGAISRGRQVVAFGDGTSGSPGKDPP